MATTNVDEHGITTIHQFEFFSGIGAMHLALKRAIDQNPKYRLGSVQAYDCSEAANKCYVHNFNPDSPPIIRNIEQLKCEEVDGKANIWTMSPPCQPFSTTANAKQRGLDDMRSKAFKHLTRLIGMMKEPPRWIVMENVKGLYDIEGALDPWWSTLAARGYTWKQMLLSPLQFGIPNNRTRFFMICTRHEKDGEDIEGLDMNRELQTLSDLRECCGCDNVFLDDYQYVDLATELPINFKPPCKPIGEYVATREEMGEELYSKMVVADKILGKRWARGLSVVGKEDQRTFCFTSSYGTTYHKSAGSLYHMECEKGDLVQKPDNDSKDTMQTYHSGKIRLFTPKELLGIFDFPAEYCFPPDMPLRHRYKLVGQSVNVKVAEHLFHVLFCPNQSSDKCSTQESLPKRPRIDAE